MSIEDKREGEDDAVETVATDQDTDASETPIEDAEVVEDAPADADDETLETEEASSEDTTEPSEEVDQDQPSESEPEPVAEEKTEDQPKAAEKSSAGVMSTVFGGFLAALVGFGSAQFISVDWMDLTGLGTDPVADALSTQSSEIEALRARLAEVEAAATDTAAVDALMSGISADLVARFAAVTDEVSSLTGNVAGLNGDLSGQVGSLATTVAAQLEEVDGALATSTAQVASVGEALTNVETRMVGIGDRLDGVDARMAEVEARLVEVEKRPFVESSDTARAAIELYETRLEELRAVMDQQAVEAAALEQALTDMQATATAQMTAVREEAETQMAALQNQSAAEIAAALAAAQAEVEAADARIADIEAQADARAELAVAQASLAQVEAALNAGVGYEGALPALTAVIAVPAVITDNAALGIPTLDQLQQGFADGAQAAANASVIANMGESAGDRLTAFLRATSGVRSTEAREGNSPDAVLSRMTVAVEAGDLATALAEAEALPEAGKTALTAWINGATARLGAEAALPDLAASLNSN